MKDHLLPHAYSDMVFKFLLGREECKEQLISFINAVLEQKFMADEKLRGE
ncbi:MAG: hypothetical protein PF447_02435 [Spirochaetaceae bacterium]|jgi:hypothetical protein|nr:hypothetical protein [Spirochaetaceae bacterium]